MCYSYNDGKLVKAKVIMDIDIGITIQSPEYGYIFCLRSPSRHKQIYGRRPNRYRLYKYFFSTIKERIEKGVIRKDDIEMLGEKRPLKASAESCGFY